MKRLLIMILCMVLVLNLSGCGAESENTPSSIEESTISLLEPESTPKPGTVEVPVETQAPIEIVEEIPFSTDFYEYESVAEILDKYGIRFGAAMSSFTAQDYTMQALVGQHFNSITATNEMKAYSMLDLKGCRDSADGMPVMDYSGAAAIIDAAVVNGAQVRGHVLVWDAYMTDWFFREGYKSNADYVDRETMKKRMESYITQVITYFEETYPGVVYCWDVVNEAVGDGEADYMADDDRHVRKYRGGADNLFYKVIGDDYVELAFLYAKNAVEELQKKNPEVDIKLIYNDYNAFYDEKRDAICALVESINSFDSDADGNPRKLCDGVGMQGYIGGYGSQNGCLSKSHISMIKKAVEKYASLGVEVQITEMALRNYSQDEKDIEKHADMYAQLIRTLVEINSGEETPLTCIAIWGLTDMAYIDKDSYEYKMNGPYSGLFTPGYEVKDAFHRVYVTLKELE